MDAGRRTGERYNGYMGEVALSAVGLTKRYGRAVALDGLDLEVRTGEVHAFLGPNGAGKTTTIRILLGLLRKDGGEVGLLSAVLRLRTEETGNLADPVLAAATGRIRWALSHISVAVSGACLLLVAAGVSTGLGYGIATGSVSTQVPRLLGAALARLPATLVLAAVAVLLFGLLPWESVALAWAAMALMAVITVFGPPLRWPAWMMDISPFTQTPKLPGGAVLAGPLLWLGGTALALTLAGLAGLRRRDVGDLGPTGLVRPLVDRLADYIRESNEISQQAAPGTTQPPVQPSPSTPPGPPAQPG